MTPSVSTRMSGFTESVIRRMTRIAKEWGAINLSQGFPDFDPPQELTDALRKGVKKGSTSVRFHFAKKEKTLLKAGERLMTLREKALRRNI